MEENRNQAQLSAVGLASVPFFRRDQTDDGTDPDDGNEQLPYSQDHSDNIDGKSGRTHISHKTLCSLYRLVLVLLGYWAAGLCSSGNDSVQ